MTFLDEPVHGLTMVYEVRVRGTRIEVGVEVHYAEGAFTVTDPELATAFWRYFTDESRHDFMPPGSADEKRAFEAPPWQE